MDQDAVNNSKDLEAPLNPQSSTRNPQPSEESQGLGGTNSRLRRLIRKELNEILRDRRTILTLVFMPLLLYPLMMISFRQFFSISNPKLQGPDVAVLGFQSEQDYQDFERRVLSKAPESPLRHSFLNKDVTGAKVQSSVVKDVRRGEVDVVLIAIRRKGEKAPVRWEFVYSDKYQQSLQLFLRVRQLFEEVNHNNISTAKAVDNDQSSAPYSLGFLSQDGFEDFQRLRAKFATEELKNQLTRNVRVMVTPKFVPRAKIEQAFQDGRLDILVVAKDKDKHPREWEIRYRPDSVRSMRALLFVQGYLANLNSTATMKTRVVEPRKSEFEFPIATLVPLVLILMTITGAVYPAIDLTAGERERGTLEILIAAPVPRMGLLFAKYVSVLVVAMLTAVVNLTMMVVTIQFSELSEQLFGPAGITYARVSQILALLLLFAGFFSAVLLMITSFARSFKEAQAYLVPVMLISLAPGLASLFPGLQLTPTLALVPLLNIVLLGRDLFQGVYAGLQVWLVVASTIAYAVTALCIAARIFGAEDVLYKEQTSWRDLFRQPPKMSSAPSVANAIFCLSLIFLFTFFAQALLKPTTSPLDMSNAEIWMFQINNVILGVVAFAVLPLLLAMYRRIEILPGFRLSPFGTDTADRSSPLSLVLGCVAAVTLGLTLWPFVFELSRALRQNSSPQLDEHLTEVLRHIHRAIPLVGMILFHVIPAIVEELFFRGFLFRALEKVSKPWVTIATSAVLFGLLHMLASPIIPFERFVASTTLGLVLGVVAWRTGGVLAPILLHCTHNALMIWLGASGVGRGELDANVLLFRPEVYLFAGAGVLVAGLLLFGALRWPPSEPPHDEM